MVNQKGGVGKTTTAVNLSAALAIAGQRTLLVDMDPQCNATTSLGVVPTDGHALVREDDLVNHIVETRQNQLSLLPGSRTFHDVDKLAHSDGAHSLLVRRHFDAVIDDFDFVLIDCPPSVGALTQTALAASTDVLIPIQCEYFAMEGLAESFKRSPR